jgi:putative ABC transport system permease protein
VGGLRTARRALRTNKLRSFLTMLGIIVGVGSVITMVAIGSGAQTQIAEQIRTLGANVLMIEPGARRRAARAPPPAAATRSPRRRRCHRPAAAVQAASPSVRGIVQIVRGNRNWNTTVNGTTSEMFVIREWPLARGRTSRPARRPQAGRAAMIGKTTVARELFGDADPIGGEIRILNTPFEVVGVLAEKGTSGAGRDQDDVVFVPISTAKLR